MPVRGERDPAGSRGHAAVPPPGTPGRPLRILPRFLKAHGHGNDYLVFDEGPGAVLTPELIRRICDRHRGPGADGIVVVEAERGEVETSLRMFNPDGGEFERSGNGLRIAGVYLRRRGAAPEGWFPVVVGGDRVRLRVSGPRGRGSWDASVEMGKVGFPVGPPFVDPAAVDGRGRVRLALPGPGGAGGGSGGEEASPGGLAGEGGGVARRLEVIPVSVGNPHAVAFAADWSRAEADHYGPMIGAAAAFPRGTNVQFACAPAGREMEIRIWERGVGRTLASGTSACAAVAAAVRAGLMPCGRVAVRMEGGTMEVELREDWSVSLHGPVEEVCDGVLAGRFGEWVDPPGKGER